MGCSKLRLPPDAPVAPARTTPSSTAGGALQEAGRRRARGGGSGAGSPGAGCCPCLPARLGRDCAAQGPPGELAGLWEQQVRAGGCVALSACACVAGGPGCSGSVGTGPGCCSGMRGRLGNGFTLPQGSVTAPHAAVVLLTALSFFVWHRNITQHSCATPASRDRPPPPAPGTSSCRCTLWWRPQSSAACLCGRRRGCARL